MTTWTLAIVTVALLHGVYLMFQAFGGLLVLRDGRWLWAHIAAVAWGVGIVVAQGRCPVTAMEKHLIAGSGGTPYTGSFLDHYVFGRVLPDGTQAPVYALHLLIIVGTYVYVLRRLRHRRDSAEVVPSDEQVGAPPEVHSL